VIFGTKCPSMMSMCSHKAPLFIVSEHSLPRLAKSAERIEGAMIAGGDILKVGWLPELVY
jgi:hypothetical protein